MHVLGRIRHFLIVCHIGSRLMAGRASRNQLGRQGLAPMALPEKSLGEVIEEIIFGDPPLAPRRLRPSGASGAPAEARHA